MSGAQARLLSQEGRLHLQHGPIDLIVQAEGPGRAMAFARARARFENVLEELVEELPDLRRNVGDPMPYVGAIALRMQAVTRAYLPHLVTPMAAVAGAVADEIVAVMAEVPEVHKAHVNNGGDVAFHLSPGHKVTALIAGAFAGQIEIPFHSSVRGLATSGWRGRSLSFGVADTVTVLASDSATADVAATMIANHVDVPEHVGIVRKPACDVQADSDLGTRLVTVHVAPLGPELCQMALARGAEFAQKCAAQGLIHSAVLAVEDQQCIVGNLPNFIHEG